MSVALSAASARPWARRRVALHLLWSQRRANASTVRDLLADPGTSTGTDADVTVSGWLRTVREHKTMRFAELHDGSSAAALQLVWPADAGASARR